MTRVNVGIDPKLLSGKHLIAEHREIKRIPNMVLSGKAKIVGIPDTFRLGIGHVKFFYNKLKYLRKRYLSIYRECKRRGFDVTNYIDAWRSVPPRLNGDYQPTTQDRALIVERLILRDSNYKDVL